MRQKVVVKYSKDGPIKVGEALRLIRLDSGHSSQMSLSNTLHRDRSGLSRYELGETTPTLPTLYDIAEKLDYELEITFKPKEDEETKKVDRMHLKKVEISKDTAGLKDMFNMFEVPGDIELRDAFVEKIKDEDIYIDRDNFDDIGRCILTYTYSYAILNWYESVSDKARSIIDQYMDRETLDKIINDIQKYLQIDYKLTNNEILKISEYICKEYLNDRVIIEIKSGYGENIPEDFNTMIRDIVCALMIQRGVAEICIIGIDMEYILSKNENRYCVDEIFKTLLKECISMFRRIFPDKDVEYLEDIIRQAVNVNKLDEHVTLDLIIDIIDEIKDTAQI